MAATQHAPLALAPAPPPARPRVLLIGTALAAAATAMLFAGLIGVYLQERSLALKGGGSWLPQGTVIPLTPGTMGMIIMAMSAVVVQWAFYSVGNHDRVSAYCAMGLTLLLGAAYMVEMAYYYTQIGLPLRDPSGVGVVFYALTGAHVAFVGVAMVFVLTMAFRTLGGQYSGRDREGLAAAVLLWDTTVVVYAAIWYAVYITK
jgi:heme/copper-type cytochrome/quinol oxidase subunit 3